MEVNVTFPEEYQAKELAGKAAVFKCTVKSESRQKSFRSWMMSSHQDVSEMCDTLDEYKAEVRGKV